MNGPKKLQWVFKSAFLLLVAGSVLVMAFGGGAYWYFSKSLPNIIRVSDYRPLGVTQILASHDGEATVLAEFFKERRYVIPYEKIPKVVVDAFISAEDDQFFTHQGINFASIIRAAFANLKAGQVVQGGSTITQQVAKSLLLTPEKSFVRKAKELMLAGQMEQNLRKEDILFLYLNQIYLGHGAYGVQAAAKVFFHKDISDISLGEAALLGGMPQAPGKFSPHLNPKKSKDRQLYVLDRMFKNHFISRPEYEAAVKEPVKVFEEETQKPKRAAYLVEHLRRYVQGRYGEQSVYEGGLQILVEADPKILDQASETLKEGLRAIDKRGGFREPLRHLKNDLEVKNFDVENRKKLITESLGYRVLRADGKLSLEDALHEKHMESELDLLRVGAVYTGRVVSINDRSGSAAVDLGGILGELPLAGAAWGRAGLVHLSQILKAGDVIRVRAGQKRGEQWIVSLEQDPEIQGAVFSMDAQTGQVLAMEGGFDFTLSEFNRATQAKRQIGSSFKPIIFAAAVEKGYTPATVIVDSPVVFADAEYGNWKPANFEEKFYGDTTFRQALIKSRNIPTIKIVQEIQVPFLIDFAKRLGFSGEMNRDLSIALGSSATTLSELVRLYSVFPRLGRKLEPIYFSTIKDRDGKVLEESLKRGVPELSQVYTNMVYETPPGNEKEKTKFSLPAYPLQKDPEQVLDPRVAYVMTYLMKEVVSFGTGAEAKNLNRPSAGKTGTTNDYQDAWYVGFTPRVVTGVWIGYDNLRPIGNLETGAKAALPIWLNFMKSAVEKDPVEDFRVPPGISMVAINPQTGKRPTKGHAGGSTLEAFIEGTEPVSEEAGARSETGQRVGATPSTSDFLKEDIQ